MPLGGLGRAGPIPHCTRPCGCVVVKKEECSRCQFGTLNVGRGSNVKYLPYAFTEHGICMLSGLLRSSRAIEVSIAIMRAFVAMRRYLISHGQVLQRIEEIRRRQIADQLHNDERFDTVLTALATGNLLPSGIRFILVDGAELHNLGSSINCLGRRVTSYSTRDKKEIKELLALMPK